MKILLSTSLVISLVAALKAKPRFIRMLDKALMPAAARSELHRESDPGSLHDHSIDLVTEEALEWLKRAQDSSLSADGGVARDFTLGKGWNTSYPETSGYIVPTLIREARQRQDADLLARARTILDWLVEIQMPCGGYQGGVIGASPLVPVTFNTGQILLGLADGVREFGEAYRPAMCGAADWLVSTQHPEGYWYKNPTPFAAPGEKVYETHVAFGLFEAARLQTRSPYADAAMRNIDWALSHQTDNGWFEKCCLTDPADPLTHTIGYALRGIVEAYRFSHETKILNAAIRTAEGIMGALGPDGFLPGRMDARWKGTVSWSCLTGTAQIAICWLMLYLETGDTRFRDAAFRANRYVRSTVRISGPAETRGAVKGSFPVSGDYCRFEYPNWATKFFIDANSMEKAIREEEKSDSAVSKLAFSVYAASR